MDPNGKVIEMSDKFAPLLKPLDKTSVSGYVTDLVMDYLLQGKLKPGDKLPTEHDFAERLGVGRNSIREAMKMLSSLGVIEIMRGEGTFIAREISDVAMNPLVMQLLFSKQTPRNLIELRIMLDSAIAELAVRKLQPGDLDALNGVNRKLFAEEQKRSPDESTMTELDMEFHRAIAAITRNELVMKLSDSIYKLFFASMQDSLHEPPSGAFRNHQLIIDAMATGDLERVRQAVYDSLHHWRRTQGAEGDGKTPEQPTSHGVASAPL
ncbi:MAG: FadR family transcriptional regulator [Alphaproteobacteria bacterium]|nr:FadR family transcriptional regulator [Alphaproteobacteria bacterium]